MKKERRGNEKWNMLVVQGMLVVFAIPVLYLAKKEKEGKKRKGNMLVVQAFSWWLMPSWCYITTQTDCYRCTSHHQSFRFENLKLSEKKKRKKMVQKKPLIIFFEVGV